ncbi:hypothetical protein MNB_SM-7-307 [hydrothermal vent metagenome]|uniref:Uncharacterized protein n=1 Tax=hydrothermal vent metagenome TaxID=652676 RepID=A0A1W1BD00_9ZZZZ
MLRGVFLFFTFCGLVFANELIKVKEYHLKKDEIKKILVKYASSEKLLTFRWTLYKNDALVVFSSYDQIVSQHLLYLNHTNQSLRIELVSRGAYEYITPYLLIRFDEFDFGKDRAKISLWLYDKRHEVYLKYLN